MVHLGSTKQYFELALANFTLYSANFYCCECPNVEQIMKLSGHTARVSVSFPGLRQALDRKKEEEERLLLLQLLIE